MPFIDEFLDMLTQTVTVAPYASQSGYGEATYGVPVTLPARIEGKIRMVRGFDGDEKVSTVTVYVAYSTQVRASGIGPTDQITLPDTFTPRQPPLLSIAKHYDETDTLSHEVLYA